MRVGPSLEGCVRGYCGASSTMPYCLSLLAGEPLPDHKSMFFVLSTSSFFAPQSLFPLLSFFPHPFPFLLQLFSFFPHPFPFVLYFLPCPLPLIPKPTQFLSLFRLRLLEFLYQPRHLLRTVWRRWRG